jgi:4-azaleucine resistance transporter AzlC
MTVEAPPTRRAEFWAGTRAMIPLIIGGIPFGVIYGALAVTSGLSPAAAMGMSLVVFAGSAQFIAVGLVAQGAALPLIVLTTFVVNLRHALYSASLAPHVRHLPQRWLVPLAALLTDESFVVTSARYERGGAAPNQHWYFLGANLAMYVPWQLSTLAGIIFGAVIPNIAQFGLDFAYSATFIGMLVPMIKNRPVALAVTVAGGTALLAHGLPNQMGLFLAAIAGVVAGVVGERLWPPPATVIMDTEVQRLIPEPEAPETPAP